MNETRNETAETCSRVGRLAVSRRSGVQLEQEMAGQTRQPMEKYAVFFSYTRDTWARMVKSPGDRAAAVRQLADSVGGSLEFAYWLFGAHDGFVVVDVPDSVRAAALSVAVGSTGAFKHLETYELFTQDQLGQMLSHAKDAAQAYQPPGQQG